MASIHVASDLTHYDDEGMYVATSDAYQIQLELTCIFC